MLEGSGEVVSTLLVLEKKRDGASAGRPLSSSVTMPWRNQDFTEWALGCQRGCSACSFESLGWKIWHWSRESQKPRRCSVAVLGCPSSLPNSWPPKEYCALKWVCVMAVWKSFAETLVPGPPHSLLPSPGGSHKLSSVLLSLQPSTWIFYKEEVILSA